jgi:catechol 2,3-dioxygenase
VAAIRPQLTHAGIYVFDLDKMRRFYTEVMGLMQTDTGHGSTFRNEFAFLSADPTIHHQVILADGRQAGSPSTVNQLSFRVASLAELRTMAHRVREYGIAELRPVSHGNAWSIYFPDPEGNWVEIYLDTPFHTAQPHADPLDLEASDDAILRATEKACANDPEFMPIAQWQGRMQELLAGGH